MKLTNKQTQHHLESVPRSGSPQEIIEVQADGDELDALYEKFPYLYGRTTKRVVRFFGPEAQFIIGNWY